VYAEVATRQEAVDALRLLRVALPVGFWNLFHANFTWFAQTERNRALIAHLKKMWPDYNTRANALKFISYFGAVKAHSGISWSEAWDSTGQAYFEPTNAVYSCVLERVWPGCLPGMSNVETRGDVLEAFLGMIWFMDHPDNMQKKRCHNQVQICDALHKVISWVYDHWAE
jgi:hypothetical protein